METAIPILYRDDHLLLLSKPSGLLVHRGWARDDATLVDYVRELEGGGPVFPVHRLDRGTSGVILFARSSEMAATLQGLFERGTVRKTYLALVRGRPSQEGLIDHPIPRKEGGPRVASQTRFRTLATLDLEPRTLSLVLAEPITGRLHQVRRHLKHLSHPLLGDANYGKGALNRAVRERYGLERLALHALRLELSHPVTKEALCFHAPLPDDLAGPLARMGFALEDILGRE